MRFVTICCSLILAASVAKAQDKAPKIYHLDDLTAAQVDLIGRALMEMPYKDAAPLLASISNQIKAQQDKAKADK